MYKHRFMKKTIIILLFSLGTTVIHAQTKMHIPISFGATMASAQDLGMSPLIYRGLGLNASFGFFIEEDKHILRNQLMVNFASMANKHDEYYSAMAFKIDYTYTQVRKIANILSDQLTYYLGGQFMITGNSRLNPQIVNIPLGYDISESLGITNWARFTFEAFEKDFSIDAAFTVPFITHIMRPGYTSLFNFTNPESNAVLDILERGKFVSFGKYQRLTSFATLNYSLKNGNMFMLSYCYDFYAYNEINEVKAANHAIYLSLLFNLN